MKSNFKPIMVYVFYILHFMVVIYFGIKKPHPLTGWAVQQAFAISIIAIGIILYVPAFLALGVKKSSNADFSGLVKTGSYSVMRNPQMLGWFIILFGWSLYFDSLISLILTLVFCLFFKTVLQPKEERQLAQQYGKKYLAYKRETVSGI